MNILISAEQMFMQVQPYL